ncbi:cysteine proteinase, partial [Trametes sanguinea]
LGSQREWLSSTCVDGCASLLKQQFSDSTVHIVIFSSYVADSFRANSEGETLWRLTEHTKFWEKTIWILPVHHQNHWVLGLVDTTALKIVVFDSLGHPETCEVVANQLIHKIVVKLQTLASQTHTHAAPLSSWVGHPSSLKTLQTDTYNCGVWILACMVAILSGKSSIDATEDEIKQFRYWLFVEAFSLPTSRS